MNDQEYLQKVAMMIKRDLKEWYKLWDKLDKHGKKFTKNDLDRLAFLQHEIDKYKKLGVLEDKEEGKVSRFFGKIKEILGYKEIFENPETLVIPFRDRKKIGVRQFYEEQGFDADEYRKFRLAYQGNSIIGGLLHSLFKDRKLRKKIEKEIDLIVCVFVHDYDNKYDRRFIEKMIEVNIEKHAKLAEKYVELWEIIKRNGRWKLNLGLFKLPLKRESIPFDAIDLRELKELEDKRRAILYPKDRESELIELQRSDDKYKKLLMERGQFLGTIGKDEVLEPNENKILNLQAFVEKSRKNKGNEQNSMENNNVGIKEKAKTAKKEEYVLTQ